MTEDDFFGVSEQGFSLSSLLQGFDARSTHSHYYSLTSYGTYPIQPSIPNSKCKENKTKSSVKVLA